jgi:2-iminobutanoate/2-iminopropanoate deaminase
VKEPVNPTALPKPIGPYSQGIRAGELLFCSGQIGLDPKTGQLVQGVVGQTGQAIKNLIGILNGAGMKIGEVVKTTVFMADLSEYSLMNEEYAKYFFPPFPARTTVQAAALPRGARVEIDAIAVKSF